MWSRVFTLVAAAVFAGSMASAESTAVTRCAGEIAAMHGVWVAPQSFLPVYGNWELMTYLASVKGAEAAPVMPVFSPEPLAFRSAHVVFVSTGLILKAGSETELAEAIRKAPLTVLSRELPGCGTVAPVASGLAEMQQRMTAQLANYDDVTTRHLRRREQETR